MDLKHERFSTRGQADVNLHRLSAFPREKTTVMLCDLETSHSLLVVIRATFVPGNERSGLDGRALPPDPYEPRCPAPQTAAAWACDKLKKNSVNVVSPCSKTEHENIKVAAGGAHRRQAMRLLHMKISRYL